MHALGGTELGNDPDNNQHRAFIRGTHAGIVAFDGDAAWNSWGTWELLSQVPPSAGNSGALQRFRHLCLAILSRGR